MKKKIIAALTVDDEQVFFPKELDIDKTLTSDINEAKLFANPTEAQEAFRSICGKRYEGVFQFVAVESGEVYVFDEVAFIGENMFIKETDKLFEEITPKLYKLHKILLEYMEKKNNVLLRFSDTILVPKTHTSLLGFNEKDFLNIARNLNLFYGFMSPVDDNVLLTFENCPYCSKFTNIDNCQDDCPMGIAGDSCLIGSSRYHRIKEELMEATIEDDRVEINKELIHLAKIYSEKFIEVLKEKDA